MFESLTVQESTWCSKRFSRECGRNRQHCRVVVFRQHNLQLELASHLHRNRKDAGPGVTNTKISWKNRSCKRTGRPCGGPRSCGNCACRKVPRRVTNKRLKFYTEFLTENLKSWHKLPLGNTPQLQKNCSVWHMNTWGCAWKVEKMFVWPAAAERRKASQSLANGKSVLCARASLYTLTVSLIFAAEVSHINSTFPSCSVDFPLRAHKHFESHSLTSVKRCNLTNHRHRQQSPSTSASDEKVRTWQ